METIENTSQAAPAESAPAQEPVQSQPASTEGDNSTEAAQQPAPEEKRPEGPSRLQKRIDELTRRYHESERARQEMESKFAQEQRQREFARQFSQIDAEEPQASQFSDLQQYGRALAEWSSKRAAAVAMAQWQEHSQKMAAEQAQAARQMYEQQTRIAHENQALETKMAAGVKHYPDFMQVVTSEDIGSVRNTPLFPTIMECENAHHIAYALAKNPGEIDRLLSMHPLAMARAVFAMDAKFSGNTVTQAPPPPPQRNGTSANPGGKPDPRDTAAWMKWREEQERQSRRRR